MTREIAIASVLALAGAAQAQYVTVFCQGFETDANGILDADDAWAGDVSRVASGTGGITSKTGGFHAVYTQGPTSSNFVTGPFTQYDGYRASWPGGMIASADVYLDTGWASGEGFDLSAAANGSDGNHQRDFIFHVTKDTSTGNLLVGGSNNTNFDPREDLDTLANHYVVPSSGWYTFEHLFYESGGTLAVDLNLRDAGGALLFTETRNDISDTIPAEVGGNRYGWFTNIDIAGGIAVDNVKLEIVPAPGSAALLGLGGLVALRRRR